MSMKTLRVKARPGVKVPREGRPRTHITDQQAATVTCSSYYRRALKDGDLVELDPKTDKPVKPAKMKEA